MRFAVLLTCYNRKATTLECLRRLFACKCPADVIWDVWLNNDGCTDGTFEAVSSRFPKVNIVQGSGHDFWCGGMRRAWDAAIKSRISYDGYLWLNDDTYLFEDALASLFKDRHRLQFILVGATCSVDGLRTTYSGRDGRGLKVDPAGVWMEVSNVNGNFVWVPVSVYAKLGNFPDYLTHAIGDFDYGLRARENGIRMYLLPNYVGICDDKKAQRPWQNASVPLMSRLRNLYSPTGGPEPNVYFCYNMSHYGMLTAIRFWLQQHARVFFPSLPKKGSI